MKGLQRKKISEGLEDVAKYLGLKPENTIFIHSTNISPTDKFGRLSGHFSIFDHSQTLFYLPKSTQGDTAKSIVLFNHKDFLTYLHEIGIAPKENYINLDKQPRDFSFKHLSVQEKLLDEKDISLNPIRDIIRGRTIVSSYLSENDLLLADKMGCQLLMDPKRQIQFNSKINLREFAPKYEYMVPPGVEIKTSGDFESKISELKKLMDKYGIYNDDAKIWCKLDSQSSGTGTISFNGLDEKNIEKLKLSLINFATTCNLYDDSIINKSIYNMKVFTPFVIELDVEAINQNKIVANIGVEAVISESNITIVGSVRQLTSNGINGDYGRYIGSRIDVTLEKYQLKAEEYAIPAFDYFQSEGYRGFVTIDVLVVEDKDKRIVGYNIDPNARFSGGTMLLSLVQYASKKTGKMFYGYTYFLAINKSKDIMETFKQYAGDNIFLGEDSNYRGIIPLIVNYLRHKNKRTILQIAVLSDKPDELDSITSLFKDNLKATKKIPQS